MKNLLIVLQLLLLAGCQKETLTESSPLIPPTGFITYSILKGSHFSDKSSIKVFTGTGLSFNVKFDSSAIYQTIDPANQYDINKLCGFTEGNNNHINSARIGWSWNDGALRLYAYAYADGTRNTAEITSVAIGPVIHVSIGITATEYVFTIDDKKVFLPRTVKDTVVNGYWQYPYFGGDEVAPHHIYVHLKNLSN